MAHFEQHIDVDAPIETVWSILITPQQWPFWFPDMEGVNNLSAVETGGTFEWKVGDSVNAGTIVRVEPNQLLEVKVQHNGHVTSHNFTISRHGGIFGFGGHDTRIEYAMSFHASGGFIGEFIAGGNPFDMIKVRSTLAKIKELAEGQAGAQ